MSDHDTNENEHNPIYGDPFDSLISHLKERDLRFTQDAEKRRVSLTMQSRSGCLFNCRFRFDDTGDVFQIHIQNPVFVLEKFRPIAAEFLTRANWGLVVGNFQMDMKDGEVVYHVSHVMDEGKLPDEIIGRLFGTAMGTLDRYWQGMMRILFAGETPADAIDLCELYRFEEGEPKASKETKTRVKPASKRSLGNGNADPKGGKGTSEEPPRTIPPPTIRPEDAKGSSDQNGKAGEGDRKEA